MASVATSLQILIVADDSLVRAGLATLLADQPDCTIAGQVPGETDMAVALEVFVPDVIVWDLGWNPALTLEKLADLNEARPPIVALLPDEDHATEAWVAGARGLLLREVSAERLVAAVKAAVQGLTVFDSVLADAVQPSGALIPVPLVEELTPRELEVLQLLVKGLSNKAIAYQLDISEHTVKFHVNAIMTKLGAQSRTEAAVRATRLGLIIL